MKAKKYYYQLKLNKSLNSVNTNKMFKYIDGFSILCLKGGKTFSEEDGFHETGLIILTGRCSVTAGDHHFENIGDRETVFDGLPFAVYIPPGLKYSVKGECAEIAVCKKSCNISNTVPVLISPKDVKITKTGKDNWAREVRRIIDSGTSQGGMIIGETINPPGNWSGTPPHKHEQNNLPSESLHEELYYFKTDKPQGWGIERFYSPDRKINELIYLQNDMLTFIPYGYHQIVSAPGYTLYYLFFLAGEGPFLTPFEDPAHSWIKNA